MIGYETGGTGGSMIISVSSAVLVCTWQIIDQEFLEQSVSASLLYNKETTPAQTPVSHCYKDKCQTLCRKFANHLFFTRLAAVAMVQLVSTKARKTLCNNKRDAGIIETVQQLVLLQLYLSTRTSKQFPLILRER